MLKFIGSLAHPIRMVCIPTFAILTACASQPTEPRIEDDQFSPQVTIVGASRMENPFGGTGKTWMLRSFIDKQTHVETDELYVSLIYSGSWRFYEMATDDHAQVLKIQVLGRDVLDCNGAGCIYREVIGVQLPPEYLAHRAAGFPIKVDSRANEAQIITVGSDQIAKQLALTAKYNTITGG